MGSGVASILIRCMTLGVALLMLVGPARAGDKSLIAVFTTGDEVRYTYTGRNEETSGMTGKPGIGALTTTTETVGFVVRCKADTTAHRIIDITWESFRLSLDSPAGKVEVDLGGPAPGSDAAPLAREVYASMHQIVGLTVTINIAPGSGEITLFNGSDQLLKSSGGGLLRRYLDRDYFAATFGPIFQLKPNSAAPPPGQDWWIKRSVFAFAHGGKTSVWETRQVENVLADIATVKATTRASGNPDGSDKAQVFFKTITGEATYKWDTFRSRLLSVTRTESISSRYTQNGILRESDVTTRSSLEIAKPDAKKTETLESKPIDKAIIKPSQPVSTPGPGGPDGKPVP